MLSDDDKQVKMAKSLDPFTHGTNNLPIPAIVYYINTLDSQLCRRGRGVPIILYVGEVFYKTINYN